ncbi:MAG TPA: acyl carrier protein [Trichormus sp.]
MSNLPTPPNLAVNATGAAANVSATEPPIKQYLSQHFLVDFSKDANQDTDLFDQGFIDSYGYVELVSFLESQFKIRFTDEELISRELRSLSSIIAMVEKKLNGN